MEKQHKDLFVFGYGLSFLIPFLVLMNQLKPGIGWALLGFLGICLLLTKLNEKLLRILSSIWMIATFIYLILFELQAPQFLLIILAVAVWGVTIVRVKWLMPIYKLWMKLARLIGTVIFGALLSIIFYFVFGIIGIVLKLLRKDPLNQRIEQDKTSYWIKRKISEFNKESYKNQF